MFVVIRCYQWAEGYPLAAVYDSEEAALSAAATLRAQADIAWVTVAPVPTSTLV